MYNFQSFLFRNKRHSEIHKYIGNNRQNRNKKNRNIISEQKRKKNMYIIMSHNAGGGLSRYVHDFIENIPKIIDVNNYDIVCNESKYKNNNDIIYVDNNVMIEYIYDNRKKYEDVIVHFNIFPKYNLYNIETINETFNNFFELKIQVIITVHDFYWIDQKNPNLLIREYEEIVLDKTHIDIIEKIFKKALIIIFPTQTCLNKYKEKNISFTDINHIVSEHIDIIHNDIKPYYNVVNDKFNILVLGNSSLCKGYNILEHLIKNNYDYTHFHLLGIYDYKINNKNVTIQGTYEFDNLCNIINNIKPHLCLLLSNYYETYSYVTSVCLKTGLPIFCNSHVYTERIKHRVNDNIYFYDMTDNYININEKFVDCLINILNLSEERGEEYKTLSNMNMNMKIPKFYNNMLINLIDYEIEKYINSFHDDKHIKCIKCTNLVLITSKIIVSNNVFNYVNKRSIYTTEERFEQTKDTINTIKKYIPDCYIILFDNSDFTNQKNIRDYLYEKANINVFMNPVDAKILWKNTNECKYKQIGELSQMKYLLSYVKKFVTFKNLFKISGRYTINGKFNYNDYDNDLNVFKKNTDVIDRNYYYTSFYKISDLNFDHYFNIINTVYENANSNEDYAKKDLEVAFPAELKEFSLINKLGITENIAVWKQIQDI